MTRTIWSVFLNGRNLAFIWTQRGCELDCRFICRSPSCPAKSKPSTAVPRTKTTQRGLARPLRKDDKYNTRIFYWNDTEKNSMDRRKDDMHGSRNVVKIFLAEVVASGHDRCYRALRSIHLCEAPADLSLFSQRVRTEALHEHSGVHAASNRHAEPASSWLVTSMRIHFHFRHHHPSRSKVANLWKFLCF